MHTNTFKNSTIQDKFILNLAPTGMIPTHEMTPHVPLTAEQIINDVLECYELGITSVHLHARDESGLPSTNSSIYAEIIAGIREKAPDLVICASCSGRASPEFEARSSVLHLSGDLKPDMASLTLSSLNFTQGASINTPDTIFRLLDTMNQKGIKPELEVFDLGMVNYANYLIEKGYLQPPFYFNIILGGIATAQADILHLGTLLRELPDNAIWSVGGIGDAQLAMNTVAIACGGGVRVGLEDNIWFDKARTQYACNQDLVKRLLDIAHTTGRMAMKPKELRQALYLKD